MGGEWHFYFNGNKLSTFDHVAYQKLLMEIYKKFKNVNFEEADVRWYEQQPSADNIFVEFRCPPNRIQSDPSWKLVWDFSLETNESGGSINLLFGLHCKMCDYWFRKKSQAIQRKLVKAFPEHFSLYYENYEEHFFDPDEDDQLVYYRKCTEDCANCGFCW